MKMFIKNRICTLIILSFIIAILGCGSDESYSEPAPAEESDEQVEGENEEEPASGTGVATEEYTADFNGHTYEFVPQDMTWEEARLECVKRGGHLVTVTSAEEEEYLKGLYLHINGDDKGGWLGAYSDGAYGGDKYDWCWVTGEKWNYTNWDNGEPSNSRGTEWFAHFWKDMTWNDVDNEDSRGSQYGYICEYDELSDITGGERPEAQEAQEEQEEVKEEPQEEDPIIEDVGKGKYMIRSKSRGVYIKYPYSYYANADGDALFAYDGDGAYIFTRNITAAAMDYQGDMKAYCKAMAEEQLKKDYKALFGTSTGMDNVKRKEGGDGLVYEVRANIWNGKYDMSCQSAVRTSKGDNGTFLVLSTCFWRYNDKVSAEHSTQFTTGAYGIGTMYQ